MTNGGTIAAGLAIAAIAYGLRHFFGGDQFLWGLAVGAIWLHGLWCGRL